MHDNFKSKLKTGIVILLFLLIGAYALFRLYPLIAGVHLKVYGATNYESRTNPLVLLTGNARRATKLSVNGHTINITKDGDWNDKVLLLPGYNEIEIQAVDKFGKEKQKILYLNFISPSDNIPVSTIIN